MGNILFESCELLTQLLSAKRICTLYYKPMQLYCIVIINLIILQILLRTIYYLYIEYIILLASYFVIYEPWSFKNLQLL